MTMALGMVRRHPVMAGMLNRLAGMMGGRLMLRLRRLLLGKGHHWAVR